MTGNTHTAVGIGATLAITHPATVPDALFAVGIGALGALICDIDVETSRSHRGIGRIITIAVLLVIAELLLNYFLHISIWKQIGNHQGFASLVIGIFLFLGICAFGKMQPHRSFMHSILGLVLLGGAIAMISTHLVVYFAVGYVSHIALDCLNYKKVRLLYPLPGGVAFDFTKAEGPVDTALFRIGVVLVVIELILTVQRIFKLY